MPCDDDRQRVTIDLCRGDGQMRGCFRAEGQAEAAPFGSWLELLALLEGARRPPDAPEGSR